MHFHHAFLNLLIYSLIKTFLDDNTIINGRTRSSYFNRYTNNQESLEPIKGITPEFIENQSFEWLHKFYKWISETSHRRESVLKKPVFLNQERKAVAAFDEKSQLILFLPVEGISGLKTVHSDLLKDSNTKKFIKEFGIKKPSLRNEIYNIILSFDKDGESIDDTRPYFKIFFEYYCNHCLNGDDAEFISWIEDCAFLRCYKSGKKNQIYRGKAKEMYLPSPELEAYFGTIYYEVRFIAIEEYKELVGSLKEKQLISFLSELGIKKDIDIKEETIDCFCSNRKDLPHPRSTRTITWKEKIIVGCKELVEYISTNEDKTKSVLLWNCLLSIIKNHCSRYKSLSDILQGVCSYFYYYKREDHFISSDELCLKQKAWLINNGGEFVSSDNVTRTSLSELYNTSSDEAQDLLEFLNIKEEEKYIENDDDDESYLTDSQREAVDFVNELKKHGITPSDIEELKRIKQQREEAAKTDRNEEKQHEPKTVENDSNTFTDENSENNHQRKKLNKTKSKVVNDIVSHTEEKSSDIFKKPVEYEEETDQDEYMPSMVDYSRRIENAKQKSAREIDRIAYLEDLQTSAMKMPKYSFGWFKILLEMESLNNGDKSGNSKEVSISFSKVEREYGTSRTLVLKYPSRYIPQFIEDLSDIPLVLHMGDTKKTLVIEVANIISYTLRVKLKSETDIQKIDLSKVDVATIDAQSPVFLLEELRKQFTALEYDDKFDMQKHLCSNIEFVFGPPGTGKTTHLAKNIILPLMKNNMNCKVLVLTPTNKAADVLVRRIMEISGDNRSYEEWLVRFGATVDEKIERSTVFKDKTFDIRKLPQNVTVTTIARFPYDFFMPQGTRIFLNERNWDYIIIDEASMIPIANIIYPLYKRNPQKFIIAGDPFQIEPITSVNLWKNENIYTLVHLNSFTNPQTVPYPYKVELLTTQFRSIPEIGNIFSNFAYGGILKHYRSSKSQRQINIDNGLNIKALNIIKFPVSKYESIYRAKRLQHSSSYQIYSALFTYEYICYLSKMIAKQNHGKLFKIGVIAPYRAQADLIDKLFSYEKIPEEIEIQVGTIHGFQGDECDMIFSVFNTPPMISANKEMFLNNLNIINVSVSRAKDYLFIVMPDDNTENIANLRLVKRIERLIKSTNSWTETFTHDLEKLIFGEHNYLENNVFSTGHQSVNVYGLPEKCYEVRTEDNAVDLQIHRTEKRQISDNTDKSDGNTKNQKEHMTSNNMKQNAFKVQVTGQRTGIYYLIPYSGKLKKYTDKKVNNMFISRIDYGEEQLLLVYVNDEEHLIFISDKIFARHEYEFRNMKIIELRNLSL